MVEATRPRTAKVPAAKMPDLNPRYMRIRKSPMLELVYVNSGRLNAQGMPNKHIGEFLSTAENASRLIINAPKNMVYPRPFGGTDYALAAYATFPKPEGISHMDEERNNHFNQLISLGVTPEAIAILSVLSHYMGARREQVPREYLYSPTCKAIRAMAASHDSLSEVNASFATIRFFELASQLISLGGETAMDYAAYAFELYSQRIESAFSNANIVGSILDDKKAESTMVLIPSYVSSNEFEKLLDATWRVVFFGAKYSPKTWGEYAKTAPTEHTMGILNLVSGFFGMG